MPNVTTSPLAEPIPQPASDAQLLHAEVLVAMAQYRPAELIVSDVLDGSPYDRRALSLLAKIKHIRGELSLAIACWALLHTRAAPTEVARLQLSVMLEMARDPEHGAGDLLALSPRIDRSLSYLTLERAFEHFVRGNAALARAHCQSVARNATAPGLYKLSVLADAWLCELTGDLDAASATLEQLGRVRGFETDLDRLSALLGVYEKVGSPRALEAAVNICHFLAHVIDPQLVLGRLALLHRRLERSALARRYAARHLEVFHRGMHRVTLAEVSAVASRVYIPLAELAHIALASRRRPRGASPRQRGIALAIAGDLEGARQLLDENDAFDARYIADIELQQGFAGRAARRYAEVLAQQPDDVDLIAHVLDVFGERLAGEPADEPPGEDLLPFALRESLLQPGACGAARVELERRTELDPEDSRSWRQLARLYAVIDERHEHRQAHARAVVAERTERKRATAVGRVLSAAVYSFVGKRKGLVHELWVGRELAEPGRGGTLPRYNIHGNLTDHMKASVRSTFLAVREYARTRYPDVADELEHYEYTFKISKDDETSSGVSAGLPLALACISAFTQRPIPQDAAATGAIVADAHDVLLVRRVGDLDLKVLGAFHRDLRCILVPAEQRAELEQSALLPREVVESIVCFVGSLDEAVRLLLSD